RQRGRRVPRGRQRGRGHRATRAGCRRAERGSGRRACLGARGAGARCAQGRLRSGVVIALAVRLGDIRRVRDLLASDFALGVDVACFLALLSFGAMPALASALCYSLGIVVHWLLSSRAVFADGVAARGSGRTWQKAQFVGSALAGLALTTAIVGAGSSAGFDPRLAKLVAIGASFTLVWLLRSRVVFRCSQ